VCCAFVVLHSVVFPPRVPPHPHQFRPTCVPSCHCHIHYSFACVSPMIAHDQLCCILSHSDAPRTDLAV
jgi:hypothetical protein